jgi:hypothetical protein
MKVLSFTFDEEANGWLSEPFIIDEQATVSIELSGKAPVLILKQEADGGYATYGQTPKESDRYELNLTTNQEATIVLATPVEVTKCYIIN